MSKDKKAFRDQQIEDLSIFAETKEAKKEAQTLYRILFDNPEFKAANSVGVTVSMGFELNTQPIIDEALSLNKTVYVPKTNGDSKTMSFIRFGGYDKLAKTEFGVLEPTSDEDFLNPPDILIVPGLAFLTNGYRLGFGAGFYDRYIEKYQPKTISLANSKQLYSEPKWTSESHDIPVDKIISVK